MTQLLFRNRWFALLWALAICFSISRFFGDGGGQQQLAQPASEIRAKRVESAHTEAAVQQDMEESQPMHGHEAGIERGAETSGGSFSGSASENEAT